MKILLVNKFLYPRGGAETFVIKLEKNFKKMGNEIQCFGMYNSKNVLKNDYNLYVTEKDFSSKSFNNIISLINNRNAYKKMLQLLDKYNPDLIISNNIEYHLTPSIIEAFKEYKKKKKKVRWFYVAHDYQIICPSHGLFDSNMNMCEKCLTNQNYWNCFFTKCHKNSRLKSLIASIDSIYWHKIKKIYKNIDIVICPSKFMKNKIDSDLILKSKTKVIHNFVDEIITTKYEKKDYIIEFGKLCKEKGTETLLDVVEELPEINFVFAGYGESAKRIEQIKNAKFVGFKSGKELEKLIAEAKLSICGSEIYENCPFSVIESQMYGTPVIGSNIGGIPELIDDGKTGFIFRLGDKNDLKEKILSLYNDDLLLSKLSENAKKKKIETIDSYCKKIINLYEETI